eukprot:TRINITY_DN15089_c0_g1_i1.p2 TRINITY_DN15089_c0_g1~~TRINITY_DN15089_c0_g1_i1.p2  ORF type:complete len:246 (+),score=95.45 TRINITY_DN15089_c0_g1_i1:90-740(+)
MPRTVMLAWVCLTWVAAVMCEEELIDNKLDHIQEQLDELSRDDPRGLFPEINLGGKDGGKGKKKPKYNYRVGDKVINPDVITFKRAKGKKGDSLEKFTVCTVTQVPGDVEGSVAEVEVDETGTVFDAKEDQIMPKVVWEYETLQAKRKEDFETDWSRMVEVLLSEQAPGRVKKLPKLLNAWKKREKDLYLKLRKDFGLDVDTYDRLKKPPSEDDEL